MFNEQALHPQEHAEELASLTVYSAGTKWFVKRLVKGLIKGLAKGLTDGLVKWVNHETAKRLEKG